MDGIIVVDKPKEYTSRDVVNIVGKTLNTRKVGHAGTLDPIATGVLVVAVGQGLKILEYLNDKDKEYTATVKMGITTDTLDITGKVIDTINDFKIDKKILEDAINSFKGKYEQVVPLYSSVKVDGERLYKYARENKEVELPKREVEIYDIKLIDFKNDEFTFTAKVSKGTYIRSLIRDIGDKIGIPCTMKELRRTKQGDFLIDNAISLEDIKEGNIKYIAIDKALPNIKFIEADDYLENRILNGSILNNLYDESIIGFKNKKGEVIALYEVYDKDNNKVKPIKVFRRE